MKFNQWFRIGSNKIGILLLMCTATCHTHLSAQIVLNEVWSNPPNGGDDNWEFIEVYGPANYDLTGYALVHANDDGVREFDEAFSLDGLTTDENGFFVIHNGRDALRFFPTMIRNPSFNPIFQVTPANLPFLNAYPFSLAHIPAPDTPGKLNNEGSSTFLLVRRRPFHALNENGESLYSGLTASQIQSNPVNYDWHKDAPIDRDNDSALDYGDEISGGNNSNIEPAQIVDEIAWSNAGGREYNRQGRGIRANKISETPGFNPDSVVRVRYFNENPMLGWTVADGEPEPTSNGDESWFYGENLNVNPGAQNYGLFKDFYEGDERTFGGPTDPLGPLFSFSGASGQENPLEFPFFENTNSFDPVNGEMLFKPYDISGLRLTPGGFNDAEGSSVIDTPVGRQFRWSDFTGDFNFDGVVDCADRELIRLAACEQWSLDDTEPSQTFRGNPTIRYTRQLEEFNSTLMMMRMDLEDGSTGEWTSGQLIEGGQVVRWGGVVTPSDLAGFDALFPALEPDQCIPCAADRNMDGRFDATDLFDFLGAISSDPSCDLDVTGDARVDGDDVVLFLDQVTRMCQ